MAANGSADGDTTGSQGASLKFSFAKSKQQRKVAVSEAEENNDRVLITGMEGAKLVAAEPEKQHGKQVKVIPKLENTYKTGSGKKFTPTFKPPANDAPVVGQGEDRFELAAPTGPAITEYGLSKRQRPTEAEVSNGTGTQPAENIAEKLTDKQQYQQDVEALPEAASLEDYESLPIEEFGLAMLRGMGWQEGQGVGRNRKVAHAIEYVARPDRLGLGANPSAMAAAVGADTKKVVKMGDKPPSNRKDMVLAPDADGRQRHVRRLDEQLVHRSTLLPGPRPGKAMRLVEGRHEGLRCSVVELLPRQEGRSERARVRLEPSQEVVEVRVKELGELNDPPGAGGGKAAAARGSTPAASEGRGSPGPGRPTSSSQPREVEGGTWGGGERGPERERDGRRDGGESSKRSRDERDDGHRDSEKGSKALKKEHRERDAGIHQSKVWLAPMIKVRIVDKKLRGGKLYLKKATVVDVHPGGRCDVAVDETGDVILLGQDVLETVVPKHEGAPVLIVAGKLRGQRAKLLKCNLDAGAAAVQLVSDLSVQRLLLDDVAQFCGSMEEDD